MGIDPGSHRLGWGIIERGHRPSALQHLASGTLCAPPADLMARLSYLCDHIDTLVRHHRPTVAAIEEVFFAKNARSALVLGQARGAVMITLLRLNVAICEYSASVVKLAVTGHGRAPKQKVAQMVQLLLGAQAQLDPTHLDTTDALAAAICHAQVCGSGAAWLRAQAERPS